MLNLKKQLFLFAVLAAFMQVNAQTNTDPVINISLKASGVQFDEARFSVKPGANVKITLTNNDDMSHNMLITQPGAREEVVNAAMQLGQDGSKVSYVPKNAKVLWHIPLLSPGQSGSVTFTAPSVAGIYPYVCTFPGHGFIMYGAMYVGIDKLPLLKDDMNIPASRREEAAAPPANTMNMQDHDMPQTTKLIDHPYPLVPPYLFRAFLPDTGPDAIGVILPQQMAYCWDGTTCRLRYAWQGTLDFADFWKSYKKYSVKVVGPVFYRDKLAFPLRIGQPDNIPATQFKGYRLIARYPEFHYTINGMDVYELIYSKPDGSGLVRTFRIPKATQTIWFAFDPGDGADYSCFKGQWVNGMLKLSPEEAQQFSVTMTKKEGVKL